MVFFLLGKSLRKIICLGFDEILTRIRKKFDSDPTQPAGQAKIVPKYSQLAPDSHKSPQLSQMLQMVPKGSIEPPSASVGAKAALLHRWGDAGVNFNIWISSSEIHCSDYDIDEVLVDSDCEAQYQPLLESKSHVWLG